MDFDRELIYREVVERLREMGITDIPDGAISDAAEGVSGEGDHEKMISNMRRRTSARIGVGRAAPASGRIRC